jgi:hypothetical protein
VSNNFCYYRLKIDSSNLLNPKWKLPSPKGLYGIWSPRAEEVFSTTWLDFMKSIGIPIYNAMIFYRGPGASTKEAHVDISKTDPLVLTNYGINWCLGGTDSSMSWYETPNDGKIRDEDVIWTAAKTPYIKWQYEEVNEIERANIGRELTLVKTGIPHAVHMGKEPRWCISARSSSLDNLVWEEITELLRSKNLLVERT